MSVVTAMGGIAPLDQPVVIEKAPINPIESLFDIPEDQPLGTIYLIDLDDTLFDHPYMLGSKAWRSYFAKATGGAGFANCAHDRATLYLAENFPVVTVEEKTAEWVKNRQGKYEVYFLTARERNIWYYTPRKEADQLAIQQMNSVAIDLDKAYPSALYSQFKQVPQFYKGGFFSDLDSKGEFISKVLEKCSPKPPNVIFSDDKQANTQDVADHLTKLGIPNRCYWHRKVEKKPFDSKIADVQLYYALKEKRLLSDQEAKELVSDGRDYLKESLELL
jgi:hypothetical protein